MNIIRWILLDFNCHLMGGHLVTDSLTKGTFAKDVLADRELILKGKQICVLKSY